MKIVAVSGSYRKGRTIETLMDKAIESIKKSSPDAEIEFVRLIEKKIEYCRNCMVCKQDPLEQTIAHCVIDDDMTELYKVIDEADAYIFGTPINIGQATAVMKAFFERIVWVMAKPTGHVMGVKGIPEPRNPKRRKAIMIISSGAVPLLMRIACDDATGLIKSMCSSSFNAKIVGSMYAGAVDSKGIESFFEEAEKLGRKLVE